MNWWLQRSRATQTSGYPDSLQKRVGGVAKGAGLRERGGGMERESRTESETEKERERGLQTYGMERGRKQ